MTKQRTATWHGSMACRMSDGRIELLAYIDDGPDRGRVVRLRIEPDQTEHLLGKLQEWTAQPETIEIATAAISSDPYEAERD